LDFMEPPRAGRFVLQAANPLDRGTATRDRRFTP
jgi:hypothetical protein